MNVKIHSGVSSYIFVLGLYAACPLNIHFCLHWCLSDVVLFFFSSLVSGHTLESMLCETQIP